MPPLVAPTPPPSPPTAINEGNPSIDDFDVGVTLGTGYFGRVRFATHRETSRHYAIKMLKKAEIIRHDQVAHMLNEKEILWTLSKDPHPFIVSVATTFQDAKHLYMVLQYIIGGEFFTHLRNATRFNSPTSQFYAAHVVLVLEFLHNKSIIYRDLKPENLLLDEDGYLKLTDFGFAKKIDFKTYTLCGTPEYLAPEVLLSKGHGKGVDWWTLGILVYEMLVGEPPFVDDNPMGIYQQILTGKLSFPRRFGKDAKSLIKKLLTADLTRRYGCLKAGAGDIKHHKWFAAFDFDALVKKELKAPIKPTVSSPSDTSNFDDYSESEMEAMEPEYESGQDAFETF